MSNAEIARILSQLATMLEIDGANPFRVRAYREAARVVESHTESIPALAREPGRLESLQGIGKDLAGKIRDIAGGGTTPLYDEMKAKIPLEVVALTQLPGMGPKRVKTLMDQLGVTDRTTLEAAVRAGKVRELKGFGETVEKNLLKGLEATGATSQRTMLSEVWELAHQLAELVRAVKGVERVEIAGSFRRRSETVGDLDLLVVGGDPERVADAFTSAPAVAAVLGRGGTKSSVRLQSGLQVDLRQVPAESFGAAMMYFTGSKAHNIELRRIALERKLLLNEYGLLRDGKAIVGRTEEEVYRALGMDWIPPELREARGEIALAQAKQLPELVTLDDIRGDLHAHTDRTDGRNSLEVMVRAARDRGLEYLAITDHSKALPMIQGFDEARVRQSIGEIAAVRKAVPGIEVLHGLEVDILADGTLDLDDETLALLDWVVVSLHTRLNLPAAEMTERVVKALAHPMVCVMGHPTGRRIRSREPVAFDMDRVLDQAARHGVAMEISAQPDRLDLNDVHARAARDRGIPLVIDTDAHSIHELGFMPYGVFVARRAGLTRQDVLNTRSVAELRDWVAAKRSRPAGAAPARPKTAEAPAAKAAKPARPRTGKPASIGTKPASAKSTRNGAGKPTTAKGGRRPAKRTRTR